MCFPRDSPRRHHQGSRAAIAGSKVTRIQQHVYWIGIRISLLLSKTIRAEQRQDQLLAACGSEQPPKAVSHSDFFGYLSQGFDGLRMAIFLLNSSADL
jgi:hypothetical protein